MDPTTTCETREGATMMYFTARCDILPGKEEELDHFLSERSKTFWLAQCASGAAAAERC